jgi:hypothetical protein
MIGSTIRNGSSSCVSRYDFLEPLVWWVINLVGWIRDCFD